MNHSQYSDADIRACILILIMGDLEQVRLSKIEAIKNSSSPVKIKGHAFVVITKLLRLESRLCDFLSLEYDRLIDKQDALVGDETVLTELQAQLAPIIYNKLTKKAKELSSGRG